MIEDFFTTPFSVTRAAWSVDEEGNHQSQEEFIDSFNGHIQQANAELVQNLGLSLTKTFIVWCHRNTNVKEGDTIADDTRSFSVRAVMANIVGDNAHLELVVELDEVTDEES